jgi:rhomboid protease GluP
LHPDSNRFLYRKAYATYVLVGINVLIFIWLISHGTAGANRIYRATAVAVPQELTTIEWWKLIAATFVHRDVSHLALNFLLLCLLGPFVEFVLGIKKYLLIYFIAGVGALLMDVLYAKVFDLYVPALRVEVPQLVGGASSAIFGIVGTRGAIFLGKWIKERNSLARNHFIFVLLVVLLQAAADLMNFSIAFGAHMTGAILGFFLGLLLRPGSFDLTDINPITLVGASKSES